MHRRDLARALYLLDRIPVPLGERHRVELEAILIEWLARAEADERARRASSRSKLVH